MDYIRMPAEKLPEASKCYDRIVTPIFVHLVALYLFLASKRFMNKMVLPQPPKNKRCLPCERYIPSKRKPDKKQRLEKKTIRSVYKPVKTQDKLYEVLCPLDHDNWTQK